MHRSLALALAALCVSCSAASATLPGSSFCSLRGFSVQHTLALRGGEDAPKPHPEPRAADPCSVYVGNLMREQNPEEMKAFFAKAGEVANVEIKMLANGKSKGFGMVTYASPEGAAKAVATLSGAMLGRRPVVVRPDRGFDPASYEERNARRAAAIERVKAARAAGELPPPRRTPKVYWPKCAQGASVYVGNIKFGTSWQQVRDHLAEGGQVVFGRIIKKEFEAPDGTIQYRSRGFAIVQFASSQDATNAIAKMDNTELNGRKIFVRPDITRRNKHTNAPEPEDQQPAE